MPYVFWLMGDQSLKIQLIGALIKRTSVADFAGFVYFADLSLVLASDILLMLRMMFSNIANI